MIKINNARLLLAKIRNGDFAHAGDIEAIDIVLSKFFGLMGESAKDEKRVLLDVGCGLGGTAAYIKSKTLFDVFGIDIDPATIKYAKSHYKNINFYECDVMAVGDLFKKISFDFICMFNVFYAIQKQRESIKNIANIAKPGALLAIFDYTYLSSRISASFFLSNISGHLFFNSSNFIKSPARIA